MRQTFSIGSPITVSPLSASRRKKSFKPHKSDLLKIDAGDIAEQLTLTIYDLYRKILPHECITYAKAQKGPGVANLREFCASHDKTSCWVQMSILTIETMKKRAETVDYWIKVAEVSSNSHTLKVLVSSLTFYLEMPCTQ
jgi:son of sevenless-like protein